MDYDIKKTRRWEPDRISLPATLLRVKLSPTALRLWIALAAFANKEQCCWPSNRRLLEMLPENTNSGTLRRGRAELEEAGLLIVTPRYDKGRQTSNHYELRYPKGERETERVEAVETERVEARDIALPINLNKKNLETKEELLSEFDRSGYFEVFWSTYAKKRGLKASKALWAKHVKDEQTAALAVEQAGMYVKATPDPKYRKDPERWIKHECWNDEIIQEAPANTIQNQLQAIVDREGLADGRI